MKNSWSKEYFCDTVIVLIKKNKKQTFSLQGASTTFITYRVPAPRRDRTFNILINFSGTSSAVSLFVAATAFAAISWKIRKLEKFFCSTLINAGKIGKLLVQHEMIAKNCRLLQVHFFALLVMHLSTFTDAPVLSLHSIRKRMNRLSCVTHWLEACLTTSDASRLSAPNNWEFIEGTHL